AGVLAPPRPRRARSYTQPPAEVERARACSIATALATALATAPTASTPPSTPTAPPPPTEGDPSASTGTENGVEDVLTHAQREALRVVGASAAILSAAALP